MKKIFLLAIAAGLCVGARAQRVSGGHYTAEMNSVNMNSAQARKVFAKTTATGDTTTLSNVTNADTATLYYAGTTTDSGYVTGTDVYGDMGFAERYDFGTADSSLNVIGVVTWFGGTVNPASTKTVTFYTWTAGPQIATGFTNVYDSGFPNAALDSVTVPVTQLGIVNVDTLNDTIKSFLFTTPTGNLDQSFFVGYKINYSFASLAGDTVGLYSSQNGERTSPLYTISGLDTIINNQNATMYSDGSGWHDNGEDNFFLANDLYIFPIVIVHEMLGVKGVTKNNLTFYGNYPNPAVNSTNIGFSLADNSGVTIRIMDMNGKVVNNIREANLAAGQHNIGLNTADMAAGNYIYVLRTDEGDGFAGKMTVIK